MASKKRRGIEIKGTSEHKEKRRKKGGKKGKVKKHHK